MDPLLLMRDINSHLTFSVSLIASPEQHDLYTNWGKRLQLAGGGRSK